jgi:Ca-activated chloride channel family protein
MPNNRETRSAAVAFIDGLEANGGTELLSGVKAALTPPADPNRVRIVLFNTDGYVGNDFEVLKAVQDYRQQGRLFTFGIGNGVNRFLAKRLIKLWLGLRSGFELRFSPISACRSKVEIRQRSYPSTFPTSSARAL